MYVNYDFTQESVYFMNEILTCLNELIVKNPDEKKYLVYIALLKKHIQKFRDACEQKVCKLDAEYSEIAELQSGLII